MKPLWKISVTTSLEAEDAVTELLGSILGRPASAYFNLETGVSLVSVFDEKPFPKSVCEEISVGLEQIKNCGLKIGAGKIETAKVKREDWAESWKKHFHPIEIGKALLVKPSWIKKRPRKNQAVVVLDPGLSFGTGQHPTTSFCLNEIVRANKRLATKSFLDVGTGSGILAIAAAKLGYKSVHAFDFDPESVRVAKVNARVNGISAEVKISRGDVTKLDTEPKKQFDLVCANLISNLLIAERKKIVAQMNRNGVLVLAGILRTEFLEVQTAFETLGLELIRCRSEKEWRSGSFSFRQK
jgi:ribosomal protein L11 methyltransferase